MCIQSCMHSYPTYEYTTRMNQSEYICNRYWRFKIQWNRFIQSIYRLKTWKTVMCSFLEHAVCVSVWSEGSRASHKITVLSSELDKRSSSCPGNYYHVLYSYHHEHVSDQTRVHILRLFLTIQREIWLTEVNGSRVQPPSPRVSSLQG